MLRFTVYRVVLNRVILLPGGLSLCVFRKFLKPSLIYQHLRSDTEKTTAKLDCIDPYLLPTNLCLLHSDCGYSEKRNFVLVMVTFIFYNLLIPWYIFCYIIEEMFDNWWTFYVEEVEQNRIVPEGDQRCGHVSVSKGLLVIQIEICGQFLKFIALPFTEILKHKLTDKFNFVRDVKFYVYSYSALKIHFFTG